MAPSTDSCIGSGACVSFLDGLARLRHQSIAGLIVELALDPGTYDDVTSGGVISDGLRTLDNTVLASEVLITSSAATSDTASPVLVGPSSANASILILTEGAISNHSLSGLRLTLRGLKLTGSDPSAAVTVAGGVLLVDACTFDANPGGAVLMTGGTALISSSTFTANGVLNVTQGGAIQMACGSTCSLEASDSIFSGNLGAQGGALFSSTMFSTTSLTRCTVQGNTATLAGGAVFLANGKIYLGNQTAVSGNSAPIGMSSFVIGGTINYALPAPVGYFASAAFCKLCTPNASTRTRAPPSQRHLAALRMPI